MTALFPAVNIRSISFEVQVGMTCKTPSVLVTIHCITMTISLTNLRFKRVLHVT